MKRFLIWLVMLAGCGVLRVPAAISVGPGGTGLLTFDTAPAVTEWATVVGLPGGSGDFVDAASLDAAVQSLSASIFTTNLPPTATTNPAPSVNGVARYNTAGHYVQMRPSGIAATVLLATLQNDSGQDHSSITVFYKFRVENGPFVTVSEQVPGWRAYFSLTGSPGSWQLIPQLSQGAPGPIVAQLELGLWPPGASLYLLWADDNSAADANNSDLEEGAYAIDDFGAIAEDIIVDPLSGVKISSPIPGQSFLEGSNIGFQVDVTPGLGVVTNVALYDGPNLIGQFGAPSLTFPLSMVYTNAAPGPHVFKAVGITLGTQVASVPVSINVVPRPSLRLSVSTAGFAVVSWSEFYSGFELHSASDLRSPVWEKVSEPDAPHDGLHHVTVAIFDEARFFRLEKR